MCNIKKNKGTRMTYEIFMPPKPNVFIKFGEDSNFCFHSYVPKPPNSFQKWMLKIFFGIYMEVKND